MKLNFYESFFYTFFVDTFDVRSVNHTDAKVNSFVNVFLVYSVLTVHGFTIKLLSSSSKLYEASLSRVPLLISKYTTRDLTVFIRIH